MFEAFCAGDRCLNCKGVWFVAVEGEREKGGGHDGMSCLRESLVWGLVRLQKLFRESIDLVGAPDLMGKQR